MKTMYKVYLEEFVDILDHPNIISKRAYSTELDDVREIAEKWAKQLEEEGFKREDTYKHSYCGDWCESITFFRREDTREIVIDNYTYVRDKKFFCEG